MSLQNQLIDTIKEESDAESDLSLDFEDQLARMRKAKAATKNTKKKKRGAGKFSGKAE